MFCPKCGRPLERSEYGELLCSWGDMYMSRYLEQKLTERYADDAPPQSPEPLWSYKGCGGVQWYCPKCGAALNACLECGRCHKHLRDLIFTLVELHPHREPEVL